MHYPARVSALPKIEASRAGTGKIEKRGVMSESFLADDFLKWECEGESGDGYAQMNEMAGWDVVQRRVRGHWTRKHASVFFPHGTKYPLVVYL
jgi:hypothetical protein